MKADARPVFDVASQVLVRELHPADDTDWELKWTPAHEAAEAKRNVRVGCRCLECQGRRARVASMELLNHD